MAICYGIIIMIISIIPDNSNSAKLGARFASFNSPPQCLLAVMNAATVSLHKDVKSEKLINRSSGLNRVLHWWICYTIRPSSIKVLFSHLFEIRWNIAHGQVLNIARLRLTSKITVTVTFPCSCYLLFPEVVLCVEPGDGWEASSSSASPQHG